MKDIDEAEALHRAAAKAFAEAVETSAEHVVEVNPHDAAAFRAQVLDLAGRLGNSTGADELASARSTFRGELRDYSEKASLRVTRLREELDAAATAMQAFAQGVSTSSGEYETVLRREFHQLEQATQVDDVLQIRGAVHDTVHTVTQSYEALKQAHNLVIAQLRDEIRVLHSELQRSQQKPELPTGMLPKQAFDKQVDDLLLQDRAFAVVLLGLPELAALHQKFPRERVEAAIAEFVATIAALAQPARVTAHRKGVFAVIVPAPISVQEWTQKLTACHVFQHDGIPRTLRIQPRLEWVQRAPGDSPTLFFDRLAQAANAVAPSGS